MNAKFLSAAVIASAALVSTNAFGQWGTPYDTDYPVAAPPIVGYGYVYPNHYSSTVEEGILNGYSNYNRSLGEYQKYYAEALINYQTARGMYIQNNLAAYKAHWAKVDMRNRRVADETQRIAEKNRLAQRSASPGYDVQFIRSNGRVTWPAELQGAEFATHREGIELAFQQLYEGDAAAVNVIKDRLRELLEFAGDSVRRNELDGKVLSATIKFRDSAWETAQQWSKPAAAETAPAPEAAE